MFRCLDSALTIAPSSAFKSPFVCPFEKREEANANQTWSFIMMDQGLQYSSSKGEPSSVSKNDGWVHVHPSSINHGDGDYSSPYLVDH